MLLFKNKMDGLEKHAYDVYVQHLSISKKKRLVEKIQQSINTDYLNWCNAMEQFLKDSGIGTKKYSIHFKYSGYTLPEKKGVVQYYDCNYCVAFYVKDGGMEATNWDDLGCPTSYVIDINNIHEFCWEWSIKGLEKVLKAFIETHPDLKE